MDIGVHTKTHVVSIVTPTETIHHCVASHKIAEAYATQVAMYKQEDDTVYIRRYCEKCGELHPSYCPCTCS